jgi:2-phosphoglycolate phosphatase
MPANTWGFRAVLFDLDGTLVDSYWAIACSVNHVRSLHGLPPLSEPEVRRHVGFGARHLLHHTVPGGTADEDLGAYLAHHPPVALEHTTLLPGAAEVLGQLSAAGLQLGVCSNKPLAFSRALVNHLGIAATLQVVLGPEEVANPKPAPDMLELAMQLLKVEPAQTLYVGDMVVDINTARAVSGGGIQVWVVPTGCDPPDRLRAARPDRLLQDLLELGTLLQGQKESGGGE